MTEREQAIERERSVETPAEDVASGKAPQSEEAGDNRQEPKGSDIPPLAEVETGLAAVEEKGHGPVQVAVERAELEKRMAAAEAAGQAEFAAGIGEALEIVTGLHARRSTDPVRYVGDRRSALIARQDELLFAHERVRANGVDEGISALGRIQDAFARDAEEQTAGGETG